MFDSTYQFVIQVFNPVKLTTAPRVIFTVPKKVPASNLLRNMLHHITLQELVE